MLWKLQKLIVKSFRSVALSLRLILTQFLCSTEWKMICLKSTGTFGLALYMFPSHISCTPMLLFLSIEHWFKGRMQPSVLGVPKGQRFSWFILGLWACQLGKASGACGCHSGDRPSSEGHCHPLPPAPPLHFHQLPWYVSVRNFNLETPETHL